MRLWLVATCILFASISPAEAKRWNAVHRIDKFTDIESCRVEPGGAFSRSMIRGALGAAITFHFFVEKRGDEIRAGLFSEPAIPISGDVQIRVDDQPVVTITAADTPIDAAPQMPSLSLEGLSAEQRANIENVQRSTLALASPYRALTGDRALDLIRAVVGAHIIRTRTIGINIATSTSAEWKPHPDLKAAIAECGIAL